MAEWAAEVTFLKGKESLPPTACYMLGGKISLMSLALHAILQPRKASTASAKANLAASLGAFSRSCGMLLGVGAAFAISQKMQSCQKKIPMLRGYLVLCRREQKGIHSYVHVAGISAMQIPVGFYHTTPMLKMYCDNFIVVLHCKNLNES